MKPPLLEARNISKSFQNPHLITLFNDLNLALAEGETVAIMGRSGEGKTTLLHILGTLDAPSQGEVWICGQKVSAFNSSSIRNRCIGFLFQGFHLLEDETTLDNVLMPAKICRQPTGKGSAAYTRAALLLEKVGLSHRLHFKTKLLSGGEKQRVALARALCNNPSLLFADEPTGNLDRHHAAPIHDYLMRLAKEEGKGVLIVTHDPHLASLCDRTLSLTEGRLESLQHP